MNECIGRLADWRAGRRAGGQTDRQECSQEVRMAKETGVRAYTLEGRQAGRQAGRQQACKQACMHACMQVCIRHACMHAGRQADQEIGRHAYNSCRNACEQEGIQTCSLASM